MTTITVEITKDKDLTAIKEFIAQLGLKFRVADTELLVYTDELKNMLDQRYADYQAGNINLISEEESRQKIQKIKLFNLV
jgi:hypothetical protein